MVCGGAVRVGCGWSVDANAGLAEVVGALVAVVALSDVVGAITYSGVADIVASALRAVITGTSVQIGRDVRALAVAWIADVFGAHVGVVAIDRVARANPIEADIVDRA